MAKISVSIDDDLLAAIREQTGPEGSVSGWLADAADRKLRAEALHAYADQVEATTGPLTRAELTAAVSWLSSATQRS